MNFILDYIYKGEVNLYQEQLDSFLECAKILEIEGLMGGDNQENKEDISSKQDDNDDVNIEKFKEAQTFYGNEERRLINTDDSDHTQKRRQSVRVHHDNITKFDVGSMTPEEIEVKIKQLYQQVDGVWRCLACDYTTSKSGFQIRRHIETHLDGLSYSCHICNKEFRSKHSFDEHNRKFHKYSNN